MQGTSTVAKVNCIVTNVALQRGFVVGCALLLLSKAKISHRSAGFRIVSRTCSKMPPHRFFSPDASRSLRNYCNSYKAADGTPLSEHKAFAFGIKSTVQNINTILVVTMKNGGFEIGDGNHISSEEERQGLMKDIAHS